MQSNKSEVQTIYDNYKNSGIEWLGDIPKHWEVKRVKDISQTKSGTTPHSGNKNYYENGEFNWIRTTDLNDGELYEVEYKVTQLALDECRLNFLPIDTVLVAMYGGFGTIGKNSILKKLSTINQSVCAILPSRKLDANYFMYFLKYFRVDWKLFADGARKDPNINQDAVKNLFFFYPPLPEQTAIAQYLDTKTQAIDKKIKILTQKTETYKELRKSIINEAVCKGLDKNVKLKESGVEWIGQIPAHWEVKRLKDIAKVQTGNTPPMSDKDNYSEIGFPWVKPNELFDLIPTFSTADFISETGKEQVRFIKKGSVMVCCIGSIGKMGVAGVDLCTNQQINSIMFYKIIPEFGKYLIFVSKDEHIRHSTGNVVAILNCENQKRIEFAFPPLSEQTAIANYLDEKTQKIDAIISNLQSSISHCKELRKTLINDVVTGKIKVIDKSLYNEQHKII